jgi:phosphoadenosine phosphosulfate reductase
MKNNIHNLTLQLEGKTVVEQLHLLAYFFPNQISFSTSFGLEDQAIAHLIFENKIPIRVFTLDTGRQFQETYNTWEATLQKYNQSIIAYYPDNQLVEQLVQEQGSNGFYHSVENRTACCRVRKVLPLRRALANQAIWITGIRAEQSPNRQNMPQLEWDDAFQIIKFHPILNWTWDNLKQFISKNQIPYNPLHDNGFVSIGCAPCTRAIASGEDFRAGRWWWEAESKKECGLHLKLKPKSA